MDPATILAAYKAATTAIDLAKKGVALYKEIKSTGGDVKNVLLDLKTQFGKIANPTTEQKKQYNEEVQRVQKIAQSKPEDVLDDVWEHLGTFVDQYDLLCKAYIESEVSAHAVYKGDKSLARRVLDRLKLRYQLDAMLAEVREQMVYHTPKELGDLWTRFEAMWMQMVAEQDEALAVEMRKAQVARWQREREIADLKAKAVWIGAVVFVVAWYLTIMISLRMTQTYRSSFSSPWWSCVLC